MFVSLSVCLIVSRSVLVGVCVNVFVFLSLSVSAWSCRVLHSVGNIDEGAFLVHSLLNERVVARPMPLLSTQSRSLLVVVSFAPLVRGTGESRVPGVAFVLQVGRPNFARKSRLPT